MVGLAPTAYCLVMHAVTGITLKHIIREIGPIVAVLPVALLAMILLPETVLWLPRQSGYVG
jgi:TRAP-type C4-dicarboxylate transport system permease large subunit